MSSPLSNSPIPFSNTFPSIAALTGEIPLEPTLPIFAHSAFSSPIARPIPTKISDLIRPLSNPPSPTFTDAYSVTPISSPCHQLDPISLVFQLINISDTEVQAISIYRTETPSAFHRGFPPEHQSIPPKSIVHCREEACTPPSTRESPEGCYSLDFAVVSQDNTERTACTSRSRKSYITEKGTPTGRPEDSVTIDIYIRIPPKPFFLRREDDASHIYTLYNKSRVAWIQPSLDETETRTKKLKALQALMKLVRTESPSPNEQRFIILDVKNSSSGPLIKLKIRATSIEETTIEVKDAPPGAQFFHLAHFLDKNSNRIRDAQIEVTKDSNIPPVTFGIPDIPLKKFSSKRSSETKGFSSEDLESLAQALERVGIAPLSVDTIPLEGGTASRTHRSSLKQPEKR